MFPLAGAPKLWIDGVKESLIESLSFMNRVGVQPISHGSDGTLVLLDPYGQGSQFGGVSEVTSKTCFSPSGYLLDESTINFVFTKRGDIFPSLSVGKITMI